MKNNHSKALDCKRLIPLELAKNITEDDSKRKTAVDPDIIRKSTV